MAHLIKQELSYERSETLTGLVTVIMCLLLFYRDSGVVLLVVVQPFFQVLPGNDLAVFGYLDRADHVKNMADHDWRERNITVYGTTAFLLEYLHGQPGGGWKIAGKVRVAQSKVAKIHPAVLRWREAPQFYTIAGVIEQGDIAQAKRG